MGTSRLERLLPLAGVVFGILMAIAIIAAGEPSDTTDSREEIFKHYDDAGKIFLGIICLGLGAILFMFFATGLRTFLRATGPEGAGSLVFAGCVVFVVGLAGFASSQFALANAADEKNLDVLQGLNYIDNNNFPPAVIGLCLIYLGMAWHILSARSLPRWLGWVSLVVGIGSLAGPVGIVALFLFAPYTIVLGILLYRKSPVAASA